MMFRFFRKPKREYVIWSNEHNMYWRDAADEGGYTVILKQAGLFTLEEADLICRTSGVTQQWKPSETMVHKSFKQIKGRGWNNYT